MPLIDSYLSVILSMRRVIIVKRTDEKISSGGTFRLVPEQTEKIRQNPDETQNFRNPPPIFSLYLIFPQLFLLLLQNFISVGESKSNHIHRYRSIQLISTKIVILAIHTGIYSLVFFILHFIQWRSGRHHGPSRNHTTVSVDK